MRFLIQLASWAVVLSSRQGRPSVVEKVQNAVAESCRALDWSGFVVLRCLGSSCWWHALLPIFGNFRVLDDFGRDWTRQNLDLWDRVWAVLMSAVTSFAPGFHFCCMACLWVSYARRPLWSVLQSCEELCIHWQLDCEWVFACYHQVCIISFCLRHRSVNDHALPVKMCGTHLGVIVKCDLYRKCESSVKVCVTHLRMRRSEFVFFLEWLSCGIWMQR